MKYLACLILLIATSAYAGTRIQDKVVEASCGQCHFQLKTEKKSCDLAVRIKGKAYFVDGTGIDEHGDAHASDGFCKRIRKARVTGEIVNGRFRAESFQLLPLEKKS